MPLTPRWAPDIKLWTFHAMHYYSVLESLRGAPQPCEVRPIPPAVLLRLLGSGGATPAPSQAQGASPSPAQRAQQAEQRAGGAEVAERLARLPRDLWARLYP